jgi:hypothetical protein
VAGDRAGRGGGRPNGGWQRGRDGGAALEVADGDEDDEGSCSSSEVGRRTKEELVRRASREEDEGGQSRGGTNSGIVRRLDW